MGALISARDYETRLGVSEIENGSLGYYKAMLMQIMLELSLIHI